VIDPLLDSRCLVTPEALVIDGANGLCAQARLGPRAVWSGPIVAALVVALVVVLLAGRGRRAAGVLLGLVTAAVVPGWWAQLAVRADRPLAFIDSAQPVRRLTESIEQFVEGAPCVDVQRNDCVACEPIVRFATAGLRRCPAEPARALLLEADALGGRCSRTETRLSCVGRSVSPSTPPPTASPSLPAPPDGPSNALPLPGPSGAP
jgi:hypothetical protein